MISDDMIHGCWARLGQPTPGPPRGSRLAAVRKCRAGGKQFCSASNTPIERPSFDIGSTTAIVPRAVAEAVLEEASVWLKTPLPQSWINELCDRAEAMYLRNPQFRRGVRQAGHRGRDYLWAFTRHWIAAKIRKWNPSVFLSPSF